MWKTVRNKGKRLGILVLTSFLFLSSCGWEKKEGPDTAPVSEILFVPTEEAEEKEEPALYTLHWENKNIVNTGINGGYPRLYTMRDGTMLLGYDGMFVAKSTASDLTFGKPVPASAGYGGTANAVFFQTENGDVYLGFRSTGDREDGSFYSSIQISISHDGGDTWSHHSTVYENSEPTGIFKGVWEPHLGMMNGKLTCFYANDSTNITEYQNIEYKQWNEEAKTWDNRTVVSCGNEHKSRDGMPVWQQLSTGEYVCVMEAFNKKDGDRFQIQMTYSKDGVHWTVPKPVMTAKAGCVCAAPSVVELPGGQLVISCQTNERFGGEIWETATVISDGTSVTRLTEKHFSPHSYPFEDSRKNETTMWNGLHLNEKYLYVIGIAGRGEIRINRIGLH